MSYARNREDVVLWRALGHLASGRYLEVRPQDEEPGRATRGLAERGWSGAVVVDDPDRAALLTQSRPTVQVTDSAAAAGLAADGPLHVLVMGGAAPAGLVASLADGSVVPWVVLVDQPAGEVEAALTSAGFQPGVHDGISRFWGSPDHAELATALDHPACALDDATDARLADLARANAHLSAELRHWRGRAVTAWASWEPTLIADWSVDDQRELDHLRLELAKLQQTVSWRVTRPLRAVRRRMGQG